MGKRQTIFTRFWPWLLVPLMVLSTVWVRLNVSPSVPRGFYSLVGLPPVLERGMLVVFPPPPAVRAWHTLPLIKPIVAVAGETMCQDADGLWRADDGQRFGPALRESQGKPLPQWHGCLTLLPGYVAVASMVPGSLDSRYFGLLPVADLTAQAFPLWLWE